MSRFLSGFLMGPALCAALIFPGLAEAARKTVFIATWRGCEEACQGFQDYLKETGAEVDFVLRDAGTNKDNLPAMVADFRSEKPDLVLTWGTSVTRAFAGTLKDLDNPAYDQEIPLIFMIVADPVGSNIVSSLEATGRPNVTGTYNRMPETVTIGTIRDYMPGFSHLGLLFNTDEKNSMLKRDELQALSAEMGFQFTALQIANNEDGTPRPDDIGPEMAALKAAGVDFVYVGSSSFLLDHANEMKEAAIAQQLPVLSPYEAMVRDGNALVSVAARYYDVGRLAGQQAERILSQGAIPGDLPVARMTDFAVLVNLSMAKQLKLSPPISLLQIAETVK